MSKQRKPSTFTLGSFVKKSYNYFERMVDSDGVPYFNIFWSDPAEAAHDTPCYGDVMARQLQAAIMAGHMIGEQTPIEPIWREKVPSYVDPDTGVYARPKYPWSLTEQGLLCDRSLMLHSLVTAFVDQPDERLERTIRLMADRGLEDARSSDLSKEGWLPGFFIESLMACCRHLGYDPAYEAASLLVRHVFEVAPLFTPENTFRRRGHMHGNLRTLLGAADHALAAGDANLFNRVDALYRYVRSVGTRFGFLPEVVGRQDDMIACETCALMDFIGLASVLANHGHPEYWADVERVLRNHLVESQVKDGSWLRSDDSRADTDQFTWRDIGGRMVGGYAGWSSPNHILAYEETIPWGGPEIHGKTRAFQNCCGGSGVHAFFIAWKNAARIENGVLSVNLHIDKLLPEAEIRCHQPYTGKLVVKLSKPCGVRIRIPEFANAGELRVTANEVGLKPQTCGHYLDLGQRRARDVLEVEYPLPIWSEEISVGNPGFRQYRYRVTWKGDTVVRIEPLGNDSPTGYSDMEKAQVSVYYGTEGPGLLYQREHYIPDAEPQETPIHQDDGSLDFWHLS